MSDSNTLISIIIPMKDEAENVQTLYERLKKVFKKLTGYTYEFIYIDDGSNDNSVHSIKRLTETDSGVKLIELSRNFGKEIATTAGLNHAKGAAAIMIDADLQHPPEKIPELIAKWQEGFDVVIGRRTNGEYTSLSKRATSHIFYKFMRIILNVDIIPNATDFRLLDRKVVDEFNRFTERNRVTRGLIDWLGFTHATVDFKADKRLHGQASYSFFRLMGLALNSTISMSFAPLYLAGYLGLTIVLISAPLGLFIVIERFVLNDPLSLHISGTAFLAVMLLFLIGVVLICMGLMAMYIANIYGEVVNRPLYVVKRHAEQT